MKPSLIGIKIVGIAQSSLVLVACHFGLGKSGRSQRHDQVQTAEQVGKGDFCQADQHAHTRQYYFTSNFLFVLVLGLVKCSVAMFVANLTVNNMGSLRHASRKHRVVLSILLGLSAAWTAASVVILALPCRHKNVCTGTVGPTHLCTVPRSLIS
jgi:ABC-type nickel/cobalt efflux system permease component RcnA